MDPRAFTGFEGIGLETITCYADDFGTETATIEWSKDADAGSPQVGLAVSIVSVSNGKVEIDLSANLARVLGKLLRVEADGACTVQIAGACTLPAGDGASLTLMRSIVGDLGVGDAPGYIQQHPDSSGGRGLILNNATTTAVEVWLG